jgi:hypothetical protein
MSTATGPNQIVTSVIQHQVKAGEEDRYEAWLREITPGRTALPRAPEGQYPPTPGGRWLLYGPVRATLSPALMSC